jgi:outer membrane lipoprotein-sorting protein
MQRKLTLLVAFVLGSVSQAVSKAAEPTQPSQIIAAKAPASPADNAADLLVAEVVARQKERRSISADLIETVAMGSQRFKATGRFVTLGSQLRLEFHVSLGEKTSGSLLEISDGETLWSVTELVGTKRVTRRDVRQIAAAAEAFAQARQDSSAGWLPELGIGGLIGLIASMERTMTFSMQPLVGEQAEQFAVVEGRWKPEFRRRFTPGDNDPLPEQIPDSVRLFIDRQTYFPQRIAYLKVAAGKSPVRSILTLDFKNVVLDGPVDTTLFEFLPPEGVIPEDITRDYLNLLKVETQPNGK